MKIFTKAQYDQLIKNGLEENRDKDHPPVVKLFLTGSGCTWLLSEIDNEDHNIAFGLCDLGMGFPELGSVYLPEILEVRNRLGLGVERDLFFEGEYPLTVYADAARVHNCITEDEALLRRAANKKKS